MNKLFTTEAPPAEAPPAEAPPAEAPPAEAPPAEAPPAKAQRRVATVTTARQKRLTTEYRRACADPHLKHALKLTPKDIGVWYCLIKSDEGCESIFKIKHSDKYPFAPPVISCLTPNGVFTPGHPLCTSFTHYHQEAWDPSMTTEKIYYGMTAYYHLVSERKDQGVGVELASPEERIRLAKNSVEYNKTNIDKEISDLFYYEGSPWG